MFKFKKSLIGLMGVVAILASFSAQAKETTPYSVTISPTVVTDNAKFKVNFRLTSSSAQYAQVYIRDAKGRVNSRWYTRASAHCSSTRQTCWVTSAIPAKAGTNKVYVRAWSRTKSYSSWSAAKSFVAKKKLSKRDRESIMFTSISGTAAGEHVTVTWRQNINDTYSIIDYTEADGTNTRKWLDSADDAKCRDGFCQYTWPYRNPIGTNKITIRSWWQGDQSAPTSRTFNSPLPNITMHTAEFKYRYSNAAAQSAKINFYDTDGTWTVTGKYSGYDKYLHRMVTGKVTRGNIVCNYTNVCSVSITTSPRTFLSSLFGEQDDGRMSGVVKIYLKLTFRAKTGQTRTGNFTFTKDMGASNREDTPESKAEDTYSQSSTVQIVGGTASLIGKFTTTSSTGWAVYAEPALASRSVKTSARASRINGTVGCVKSGSKYNCTSRVNINTNSDGRYIVRLLRNNKLVLTKSVTVQGSTGTPTGDCKLSSVWGAVINHNASPKPNDTFLIIWYEKGRYRHHNKCENNHYYKIRLGYKGDSVQFPLQSNQAVSCSKRGGMTTSSIYYRCKLAVKMPHAPQAVNPDLQIHKYYSNGGDYLGGKTFRLTKSKAKTQYVWTRSVKRSSSTKATITFKDTGAKYYRLKLSTNTGRVITGGTSPVARARLKCNGTSCTWGVNVKSTDTSLKVYLAEWQNAFDRSQTLSLGAAPTDGTLEKSTFHIPASVNVTNHKANIAATWETAFPSKITVEGKYTGGRPSGPIYGSTPHCVKKAGNVYRCSSMIRAYSLYGKTYRISMRLNGRWIEHKYVKLNWGSSSTRKVPTPTDLRVISSTWTRLKFKDIGAADYRVNVYDLTGRKWLAHYHWSRSKLQCNGSTCNIGMKNGVRNHRTKVEIYNTAKTTDKYVGYHYIK